VAQPATFRATDATPVAWTEAEEAWVAQAREILIGTAARYRSVITYKALAEEVQARAGIRTKSLLMNWMGDVLERVAAECHERQEPQLTALCVRSDGTVGDGYAQVTGKTRGEVPEDPDQHAADERLACHRFFGADLPSGGGIAVLTEQVAARRRRAAPKPVEREAALCPSCFTQMPLSGGCDPCEN